MSHRGTTMKTIRLKGGPWDGLEIRIEEDRYEMRSTLTFTRNWRRYQYIPTLHTHADGRKEWLWMWTPQKH